MKYFFLILMGVLLASPVYAVRFDWVLGQPAEVWGDAVSTTTDAIWWVLGQPSVVASTTMASGGEPPVTPTPSTRNRVMIISENNIQLKLC